MRKGPPLATSLCHRTASVLSKENLFYDLLRDAICSLFATLFAGQDPCTQAARCKRCSLDGGKMRVFPFVSSTCTVPWNKLLFDYSSVFIIGKSFSHTVTDTTNGIKTEHILDFPSGSKKEPKPNQVCIHRVLFQNGYTMVQC